MADQRLGQAERLDQIPDAALPLPEGTYQGKAMRPAQRP